MYHLPRDIFKLDYHFHFKTQIISYSIYKFPKLWVDLLTPLMWLLALLPLKTQRNHAIRWKHGKGDEKIVYPQYSWQLMQFLK
jgi:hypothetical protein